MSGARDNLLARYAELTKSDAGAALPPAPPAPASGPPTAVHRAAVELLDELLSLVPHDAPPFSGIIRTLKKLEPMLLRDFAKVPPENVALFLNELGGRMMAAAAEYNATPADFPKAGTSENTEEGSATNGGPGSNIATGA